jgi:hypothetical protein
MENVTHMRTGLGTVAEHQAIRRSAHEAARLKAAHRYFQRTATRRPFRKEEAEEPTGVLF